MPDSRSLTPQDARDAARARILRTLREVHPLDSRETQEVRADTLLAEVEYCLDVANRRATPGDAR